MIYAPINESHIWAEIPPPAPIWPHVLEILLAVKCQFTVEEGGTLGAFYALTSIVLNYWTINLDRAE